MPRAAAALQKYSMSEFGSTAAISSTASAPEARAYKHHQTFKTHCPSLPHLSVQLLCVSSDAEFVGRAVRPCVPGQ